MQYRIKLIFISLSLIFILNYFTSAQGSAGENAIIETTKIVDMPTAGIMHKGYYQFAFNFFNFGGILSEFNISPVDNFSFGISYSLSGLIGSDKISIQKLPGIYFGWRFLNESYSYPAVLVGFSSQGMGGYITEKNRFLVYSPGLFLSASKNFKWLIGSIALHSGVNYSFDPPINDRTVNFYAGFEQSIGPFAAINLEYNATLNDENQNIMARKGLLNSSLRISITKGVTIQLQLRDLLNHQQKVDAFSRYLAIEIANKY